MSRKRQIKRLMALGIQRNDAAGFVKASRILMDKGMADKVPGLLRETPPIIVSRREIRTFAAQVSTTWLFETTIQPVEEKEDYIKRKLGTELGKGLLDSGLCKIQARADTRTGGADYRATIDVAVPQEVEA
jgi:hypothetical protein